MDNLKKIFVFAIIFLGMWELFSQNIASGGVKPNLTSAMIKALRIVPSEGQQHYTNKSIKFEVLIPYVKPNQVEIETPVEQNKISFKSLRRVEDFSEYGGTKIEIWFSFSEAGIYKIKPLNVRIKNISRTIQFSPFEVSVNPMELTPVVLVEFENGVVVSSEDKGKTLTALSTKPVMSVRTGEKINFKIELKYAVQLVQFNWDLPRDSIFTKQKDYEITEIKPRDKVYSEDIIPVADFEWTPLVSGQIDFPRFYLSSTGYNGIKSNLVLPSFFVNVEKASAETIEQENSAYDFAFEFDEIENGEESKLQFILADCYEIARLRSKERHSFFPQASLARKEFEESLGLPSERKEFSVIFLLVAMISVIFFLVLLVFFISQKRPGAYVFSAAFLITSIAFFVFATIKANEKYAVSKGCRISTIPETSAEVKSVIPAGNRVQIVEETDEWYYILLGENGGWCKKEEVILIK